MRLNDLALYSWARGHLAEFARDRDRYDYKEAVEHLLAMRAGAPDVATDDALQFIIRQVSKSLDEAWSRKPRSQDELGIEQLVLFGMPMPVLMRLGAGHRVVFAAASDDDWVEYLHIRRRGIHADTDALLRLETIYFALRPQLRAGLTTREIDTSTLDLLSAEDDSA